MENKTLSEVVFSTERTEEYKLSKDDLFNVYENTIFNRIKKTISKDTSSYGLAVSVSGELVSLRNSPTLSAGQTNTEIPYEYTPYGDQIEFNKSIWYLPPESALAEVKRIISRKLSGTLDKGIFTGTDGFSNIFEVVENVEDLETPGTFTLTDLVNLITATKKKADNLSLVINPDTLKEALNNADSSSVVEQEAAASIINNYKLLDTEIVISKNIPNKKAVCGNFAEVELHIKENVEFSKIRVPESLNYWWEMVTVLSGTVNSPDSFVILE